MKSQIKGLLAEIWEMYYEFGEVDREPPIRKPPPKKEKEMFIFHPCAGAFKPKKYKEPSAYF